MKRRIGAAVRNTDIHPSIALTLDGGGRLVIPRLSPNPPSLLLTVLDPRSARGTLTVTGPLRDRTRATEVCKISVVIAFRLIIPSGKETSKSLCSRRACRFITRLMRSPNGPIAPLSSLEIRGSRS